jgi:hypothetical protein
MTKYVFDFCKYIEWMLKESVFKMTYSLQGSQHEVINSTKSTYILINY